ncbi:acyl carrier protein [uncultured Sanguibacteroides sp.]|uniref:acyl carrier protein n=1 Tax=uncultured Sanguibacteroides sp. TaxID=1635151 RepID=UPI0025CC70E6|nr:acyl carrier protein [uncultured Sanguibacteroides sp.]
MTNLEKYEEVFVEVFAVDKNVLNENFNKENVESWDSIHQLNITANLEEVFDIMFEPEDIMAMTSYQAGKTILGKYNIEL